MKHSAWPRQLAWLLLGACALGGLGAWLLWRPHGNSPPAGERPGAARPAVTEKAGVGAEDGGQQEQPLSLPAARSAADAAPAAVLARAPTTVASLTGWLPAEGMEQLEELRLLSAPGVLCRAEPEANGRFLLEVPAQQQPAMLELAFTGGLRLRAGPYLLGPGVRLEAEALALPAPLAQRRGQLSLPRAEQLELLEVYGNRFLLQPIASAADGAFEFLAARAGPFELHGVAGAYWQTSGSTGGDPLRFVPWQPAAGESPWHQRVKPWQEPQTSASAHSEEPAGSAQVLAQLVASDGQGVPGLRLELSLEVLWSSPEDPERPPIPQTLQREVLSDAQGRLRWDGLPAGKARVVADGNLSWLGFAPIEFELPEGEWMNLGNLQLAPHASLHGSCQDAHGRPLLGARVRLRHPDILRPLETSSDQFGHYRFPLAPPGSCQVELLPPLGFPGLGQRQSLTLNLAIGAQEQPLSLSP